MQYRGVEITIISAKDLKRVKHLTKMDVYVVVSLSGGPEMEQKTPVDKASGPNPNWNYPMNFNIDEEEAHKGRLALKFEVKCHRRLHSDKDIGEVNVPVKELLDNGGDGKFIKYVTYQLRKPNGKHRGQLNLSYKFANQVLETTSSTKVHDTVYQVPALVTAYYPVNYAATNLNLPKSDPSVGYPIQGGNPVFQNSGSGSGSRSGLGYTEYHNPMFVYGSSEFVQPHNKAGNPEVDACFFQ
ncbi:hypothetical protein CsatB_005442 [Cannabis sativa]